MRQFLASWRLGQGPDDVFDAFLVAVLSAAARLAHKAGAPALRDGRVRAVLHMLVQPETVALSARALTALPIWEGAAKGACRGRKSLCSTASAWSV